MIFKPKKIITIFLILFLSAFCILTGALARVFITVYQINLPNTGPRNAEGHLVEFDSLHLVDLDSNTVSFSKDSTYLINIWATWCRPCVRELPSLDSLENSLNGKVKFLIASDEELSKIKHFRDRRLELTMNFFGIREELPFAFRGSSIPRTYIIHKGKIVLADRGASNWNTPEAKAFLEKLVECGSH